MSEQVAGRFIEALARLESDGELNEIVSLFSENCKLGNVVTPREFSGREGAGEFWEQYRKTFGEVKSTFRNIISTQGRAALEWTTEGTNQDGNPVLYDGVSILEIEGDTITRFHAYFDTAKLSSQIVKEARAWS